MGAVETHTRVHVRLSDEHEDSSIPTGREASGRLRQAGVPGDWARDKPTQTTVDGRTKLIGSWFHIFHDGNQQFEQLKLNNSTL